MRINKKCKRRKGGFSMETSFSFKVSRSPHISDIEENSDDKDLTIKAEN